MEECELLHLITFELGHNGLSVKDLMRALRGFHTGARSYPSSVLASN